MTGLLECQQAGSDLSKPKCRLRGSISGRSSNPVSRSWEAPIRRPIACGYRAKIFSRREEGCKFALVRSRGNGR